MPEETYSSNKMSSKWSEEDYHVVPKSETKSSKMKGFIWDLIKLYFRSRFYLILLNS